MNGKVGSTSPDGCNLSDSKTDLAGAIDSISQVSQGHVQMQDGLTLLPGINYGAHIHNPASDL